MADAKPLSASQQDALEWARAHSPFTRRDYRRQRITTNTIYSLQDRTLLTYDVHMGTYTASGVPGTPAPLVDWPAIHRGFAAAAPAVEDAGRRINEAAAAMRNVGVTASHGETFSPADADGAEPGRAPAPPIRMPLTLVDNEDRDGRIPGQPGYMGPGQ
jgi:hypothetical protein